MGKPFKVTYTVDDGYCGHRPQQAKIELGELESDMSDEDLRVGSPT